jgi:hypothetical protein
MCDPQRHTQSLSHEIPGLGSGSAEVIWGGECPSRCHPRGDKGASVRVERSFPLASSVCFYLVVCSHGECCCRRPGGACGAGVLPAVVDLFDTSMSLSYMRCCLGRLGFRGPWCERSRQSSIAVCCHLCPSLLYAYAVELCLTLPARTRFAPSCPAVEAHEEGGQWRRRRCWQRALDGMSSSSLCCRSIRVI